MLGVFFVILTNYFRILSPQVTGFVVNNVVNAIGPKNGHINVNVTENTLAIHTLNSVFSHSDFSHKILYCGLILLALAIISGFFMFLMRQTIIVMSRHIEYDQKNQIYRHYQLLDIGFFRKHSTGDLMNRISEDVSRVRMFTGPAIMYLINLTAVIGFSVYFMFSSDVRLSIYALSPLPLLAITIYYVNAIINRKSEQIQAKLSDLTASAQESYSGIRVIKSYVQEKPMTDFFNRISESYRVDALSLAKTEAVYFPSMSLLIGLSTLITILVGGLDVANNVPGASVGKIAEFVLYIQMLTFPVSAIGWTASMIQRASASQKRINEFLNTIPEIKEENNAMPLTVIGDIAFNTVNFTYQNTGIQALKDIQLNIRKGSSIAIVGRTGSGKTTLAQLIMRCFDAESGEISISNQPIKKWTIDSIRHSIAYVPQDVFLFSDTIENNIRFGNPAANEEAIKDAAKNAGIYEEIMSFPSGFQTLVGERGITLSGGQKQRISIARALLKDSPILIFDDCLSAVDAKTEQLIIDNLYKATQQKTSLIITHRVNTRFEFEQIIVMDRGNIAETGTHEQLLAKKGIYFDMYNRQKEQD